MGLNLKKLLGEFMWQELSFKHSNLVMVMETCKSQVYIEAIKDRYRHQNHPLSWQKTVPDVLHFDKSP